MEGKEQFGNLLPEEKHLDERKIIEANKLFSIDKTKRREHGLPGSDTSDRDIWQGNESPNFAFGGSNKELKQLNSQG